MANIFAENGNLDAQLSYKIKIDTNDPKTTKWQPLEVGAKSTKIPTWPRRDPPFCVKVQFWSILIYFASTSTKCHFFCFWVISCKFCFKRQLRIKIIRLKKKSTKVLFSAKLQWFEWTFQKIIKNRHFFATCLQQNRNFSTVWKNGVFRSPKTFSWPLWAPLVKMS